MSNETLQAELETKLSGALEQDLSEAQLDQLERKVKLVKQYLQ